MEIIISQTSDLAYYEQIAMQIKELIMKGELKENDPLPSIRKFAKDLHVSVITTQKAYDKLVNDGFIYVVPSIGAFVASQNKEMIREDNLKQIEEGFSQLCHLARLSNISLEEMTKLLEFIYEEK